MGKKTITREAFIFLGWLAVIFLVVLPSIYLFTKSDTPFLEWYRDIVVRLFGMGNWPIGQLAFVWTAFLSPYLIFQFLRSLWWVMKRLTAELSSRRPVAIFMGGLLLGLGLSGIGWWWSLRDAPDAERLIFMSSSAADQENWSHATRVKQGWRKYDVKDCGDYVASLHSQAYLKWERQLRLFESCMAQKGYEYVEK